MSDKVRELTVLGEFKPFGLIAESLDAKSDETNNNYDYFLFDPKLTRQRDDVSDCHSSVSPSVSWNGTDQELFIRGNRIIWSSGSRVLKRYTLQSSVIMACWCNLGALSEPHLCVLQVGTLTVYGVGGEVVSIPLPRTITSIWPLPCGLLLQKAADVNYPAFGPYSALSTSLNARDFPRLKRELGYSPQHNLHADHTIRGDATKLSSHLILKDPLEEPQAILVEERGQLVPMRDLDERTIWTSNSFPLMASYSRGKMQHSLWLIEIANSNFEVSNLSSTELFSPGGLPKQLSLRRIWQGKGAPSAASKVFMATDDDGVPVLCFLLQEQKGLLSVRLHTVEINNETLFDIKPDMSWCLPAIAAAPVIVTRPRVKVGLLQFTDIIVLSSENTLLLYSGKRCLCRYKLPSIESTAVGIDLKITGLADAVEGRVNVIVNNGQMFRCTLRRGPSSSLTNDCITAMAEGLHSTFYNHFLGLLWGDGDSAYLGNTDSCVSSEWEAFSSLILQMCGKLKSYPTKNSNAMSQSAWEFLMNSEFHKKYCKQTSLPGISVVPSHNLQDFDCSNSNTEGRHSSDKSYYTQLLVETLDSLHALYETLKLDNLHKRDLGLLVDLLCDIAVFLGEENYVEYYLRDFPHLPKKIVHWKTSVSMRNPPSIFRWLESCLLHGCSSINVDDLPDLIRKDGSSVVSWGRKIVSFYSLLSGAERTGRQISSGIYCDIVGGSSRTPEESTVLAMVAEGFGLKQLDLLPGAVSLALRHCSSLETMFSVLGYVCSASKYIQALDNCRESPPTDWPAAAYVLIGREDLALSCFEHARKSTDCEVQNTIDLISISAPYMLHLHPVTIPSSVSDTIGTDGVKVEDADSLDGSMIDGMEHIFNSSTQLRYGRDLRLNEKPEGYSRKLQSVYDHMKDPSCLVLTYTLDGSTMRARMVRCLLCSAKPVTIQTSGNPSASDQELQQAQLWQLAQRTTTLPLGRGAFTLATTSALLTEALIIPKLVLAGRLPAQQNATVNLDPSIRNIQELRSWPEFHNAVAAGLRLAPLQGKMSRTWITYNKPEEPNVTHAGLLLALGLHGHLRVLTVSDTYQYFSQEHESTTVALMLGLAASYRGTMDPSVSKSAALMALGVLYEGSAHPQTMQILLGEIGRRSGGDNVLEREGYAVASGFALGLVALGRGEESVGFTETLVDRLFQYVGVKEYHNERPRNAIPSIDDHNRNSGQMMDGTAVNVDVTAPGAIIALALLFLKTESEVTACRLSIPHTHFDLQYVRPDFIMLRVIARNLIMWSRIRPSRDWIQSQLPDIVKMGVANLGDETSDFHEMDAEALVQAYVNIVAGACISIGLRYAGTRDGYAQELLHNYATYLLNEIKPVSSTSSKGLPKGLSEYVDRGTLEICLHLVVLSLCVVMAGSGHLQTFRLLRYLRNRNSADVHANYGIQMAVSLGIGFLFLGGGMRTFSTGNGAIASLLITLYPRLPTGPNDNRCHLQAFRHFYVLSTEGRWVQTVDVDTGLPVYAPLEITTAETEHYAETNFCEVTPCILPERSVLKTVRVCGPRYWPQYVDLVPEDKPWWKFGEKNDPFNGGILYIKRKVGACSYVDDPVGCQSLLSRAMDKVCDLSSTRASTSSSIGNSQAGFFKVDQLVRTFSSDPSLIAFAQVCCDPCWNSRQDFCLQVLFDCVSKDRPALLQVYISLYTTITSMAEQAVGGATVFDNSIFISSLKIALAYNKAVTSGRLTSSKGGIVQSNFIASLQKRVEDILNYSGVGSDLCNYLNEGKWPNEQSHGGNKALFSWYLQWFGMPPISIISSALSMIKSKVKISSVPLLHLLLPGTHISAIVEIDKLSLSSGGCI
ncbi:hypothetical protein IFM89_011255 [Coptis chinensis]|uniref:Anaphase-promoting complex subunit 1 n=1 Tax=Coptis chinensis TaxID=261450 RepID=A0A835LR24_9MAGN|nr:hypothetical protein IFM89_011255 [Coptis chinensis]